MNCGEGVRIISLEWEHDILVLELPVLVVPDIVLVCQHVVHFVSDEQRQKDDDTEGNDGPFRARVYIVEPKLRVRRCKDLDPTAGMCSNLSSDGQGSDLLLDVRARAFVDVCLDAASEHSHRVMACIVMAEGP